MLRSEAVQVVADSLMLAWFPNGHGGMTHPSLADDYANWLDNARRDGEACVDALIAAGFDFESEDFEPSGPPPKCGMCGGRHMEFEPHTS